MSISETLHDQAAAYALDALEPAEARAFEVMMTGNSELEALVREYRDAAGAIAAGEGGPAPSPSLRGRLLDRVRAESRPTRWRPARLWTSLALAAGTAGLLLAGLQTVRLQSRSRELRSVQTDLSTAATRRDLLQRRLDAILDDNTQMYAILPTGQAAPAPAYGAQVFWRRDTQTWLVHAYNMPRLPANQVYQLWYVTPDARISAGVMELDDEGHGIAVMDVPEEARGATLAAMSVEPGPAGSQQPTGAIVIAGSVR